MQELLNDKYNWKWNSLPSSYRLIREFKVEYNYGPLIYKTSIILSPDEDLKFKFTDIDEWWINKVDGKRHKVAIKNKNQINERF